MDAVVAGVGTVLIDDPALTARRPDGSLNDRQPLRVVIDTHHRTPATAQVRNDAAPTWIATATELGTGADGHVDPHAVLAELHLTVDDVSLLAHAVPRRTPAARPATARSTHGPCALPPGGPPSPPTGDHHDLRVQFEVHRAELGVSGTGAQSVVASATGSGTGAARSAVAIGCGSDPPPMAPAGARS